jgi:hypothetical protein
MGAEFFLHVSWSTVGHFFRMRLFALIRRRSSACRS